MTTNLDALRAEVKQLRELSSVMSFDLSLESHPELAATLKITPEKQKAVAGAFRENYQSWYTAAHEVVRQLIPSRLAEFDEAYRADPRRKLLAADTYKIQDWLLGLRAMDYGGTERFAHADSASAHFGTQRDILEAAERRLDSAVYDMSQLVQADLFDSELDAATELLKKGFHRAAGVVAGVVLEKHLASVAANHQVKIRKKTPTIADLNDPLKEAAVYDIPTWRNIQRLGDIRNYCGHNKEREPSAAEVRELIDGTMKVTKTIF